MLTADLQTKKKKKKGYDRQEKSLDQSESALVQIQMILIA